MFFCARAAFNRLRFAAEVNFLTERMIEERKPRTLLLASIRNLNATVRSLYPDAYADYGAIYRGAAEFGRVVRAIAVVDPGCHSGFAFKLRKFGYDLEPASDADAVVFASAVRLKNEVDEIVLCSGDSLYVPLVEILKAVGLRIAVCAVRSSSDSRLLELCDRFLEVPVFRPLPPAVSIKSTPEIACAA